MHKGKKSVLYKYIHYIVMQNNNTSSIWACSCRQTEAYLEGGCHRGTAPLYQKNLWVPGGFQASMGAAIPPGKKKNLPEKLWGSSCRYYIIRKQIWKQPPPEHRTPSGLNQFLNVSCLNVLKTQLIKKYVS